MDLLALLATLADGETHSGERLAADAGMTRAAVWKSIKRLDQWGLRVEAVSGRGYRLEQPIEWLEESLLRRQIDSDERFTLDGLDVFTEIDSTNRWLAHNPPARPGVLRVCVAEWQSAGRGRRERRWVSPLGSGICLSAAWVYEGVPRDISALSLAAGVATAHVIRRVCDVGPQLKGPYDIVWNSRKLGGLLVESSIESQGR
ncbi:MAG TPA: biotin--[acetyl-CoA-carboxylase] ligase, partial [Gammaproteobacteria bacterium]|nr:biotin--[acetyl-CoA-carboxylase] ligase [Gammaproteobacteria bacterium]